MAKQLVEIQDYLTQLEITLLGVMDRAVRGAVEDEAAKFAVVTHGTPGGQRRMAGQAGTQITGSGRSKVSLPTDPELNRKVELALARQKFSLQ